MFCGTKIHLVKLENSLEYWVTQNCRQVIKLNEYSCKCEVMKSDFDIKTVSNYIDFKEPKVFSGLYFTIQLASHNVNNSVFDVLA